MGKIALISCTKLKEAFPCTARQMYWRSALFSKVVTFVEKQDYSEWYILSAKYGLLSKDQLIEPYDVTLNNMKVAERKTWAMNTAQQIVELGASSVDFYAGQKYREFIIPMLRENKISFAISLEGLGIGEQLQYLSRQTSQVL
ncbi:DUF6884 domain-containing protein [Paenibacillus allorhizosphaerae]|uniref:DUF6884 domain-containing protein n=1 Tax=Paenibacillus allorhizosphaerae TaxID=2849866 RepID=A0ABN7U0S6_9BACL|nr:DUF6884 domain-containing protein [Paenibacillus allorhizosphaerae]CAG7658366.1 hypothetical protein PAECIP111802_07023 [Paenibacillus allorhizosphaerae]